MHTLLEYVKDVCLDRETRDWDAYVIIGSRREYIGSRQTQMEAEELCDEHVYELLMRQPVITA
jgi:hypothetical protein